MSKSAVAKLYGYLTPAQQDALDKQRREEADKQAVKDMAPRIAETISLEEGRGAAFAKPKHGRGEKQKPIRRKTALILLLERGDITSEQAEAGKLYGEVYQRLYRGGYRCALDDTPRGGNWSPSEARAADLDRLMSARERGLCGYQPFVFLADKLCGEDITPTEIATSRGEAGKILGKCQDMLAFLAQFYRIGT